MVQPEDPPADRPSRRPYARIERERRFLLERLPAHVDPERYERLRDLYVAGTSVRLRRVEAPDGRALVTKLGQKVPDPEAPGDPRRRSMTTLYLPPAEGAAFDGLAGLRSVKRRYRVTEQGRTFAIDVYEEPPGARGLVLAEVECESDAELAAVRAPAWASCEVTDDPAWSGPRLAGRGREPDRG